MFDTLRQFLMAHLAAPGAEKSSLVELILLSGVAVAAVGFFYLTKLLLRFISHIVNKTPTDWDDDLLNSKMLAAIAQLSPALAINWLLPAVFKGYMDDVAWLSSLTSLYIVGAFVWILWVFIGNVHDALLRRPPLHNYAVKGVFQMLRLIVLALGVIIALSIIIGKSPLVILTALGAFAAVLILIFQDTILGLVASIQLTANHMLQRGDWIEDKTHDVNGEVIEVTLSAVKIKNWDNSISCVPPYMLLKNSFRNYQPMKLSGGRRVDRAVYLDINTVGFCDRGLLDSLLRRGFISEEETTGNPVNLTLLRNYLRRYLAEHPGVNKEMTLMVRQLKPTNAGLPLELYFFLSEVNWVDFERIAGEIFDHVYAVTRCFGISIFQIPAGTDFKTLAGEKNLG